MAPSYAPLAMRSALRVRKRMSPTWRNAKTIRSRPAPTIATSEIAAPQAMPLRPYWASSPGKQRPEGFDLRAGDRGVEDLRRRLRSLPGDRCLRNYEAICRHRLAGPCERDLREQADVAGVLECRPRLVLQRRSGWRHRERWPAPALRGRPGCDHAAQPGRVVLPGLPWWCARVGLHALQHLFLVGMSALGERAVQRRPEEDVQRKCRDRRPRRRTPLP